MTAPLSARLDAWIAEKSENGIKQHDPRWHDERTRTVGGSSLSVLMGCNPWSDIATLIANRIGMNKFRGDIKTRWGTLFEHVIKRYVEIDKKCKIYGDDMFVIIGDGTSYSPDGLAVLDVDEKFCTWNPSSRNAVDENFSDTGSGVAPAAPETTIRPAIALFEFKCPYSRIPNGMPPPYYIPQVKMGLDVLKIAEVGVFAEAVFRRCGWEQLGFNSAYCPVMQKCSAGNPLAIGIIGLYCAEKSALSERIRALYEEQYLEFGEAPDWLCQDMGVSSPELFALLMEAFDEKIILPWYGTIIRTPDYIARLNADTAAFTAHCAAQSAVMIGVLPWKLFQCDYHFIPKEPGFMEPWMGKIREINDVVARCTDPANETKKSNIYNAYITKDGGGFSDE